MYGYYEQAGITTIDDIDTAYGQVVLVGAMAGTGSSRLPSPLFRRCCSRRRFCLISVIIPAYNEGESIAATVAAIWMVPEVGQAAVVDDGSEDDTASRVANNVEERIDFE
ncbi:MAG: glycosyltransferase [Thermacetogeniaceae bacterium]